MLLNEFVSKQTRLGALRALQCTLKLFHALFYIFFQRLCTYFHEHSEPVHTRSVQHCLLVYSFSGPQWYRKGSSTKLLLASRRSEESRWHKILLSDAPANRRRPDWLLEVAYAGTKLLYQPAPQPIGYIIPVTDILGRLALVPYGEHGTIPYDWHNLACFYPRGECDRKNSPGSGSKLYYINSWAMLWPSDLPRDSRVPTS